MKIIHLVQQNKLPSWIKSSPKIIEETVQSQFMIAQEIKKHPGFPVLVEGLSVDVSDVDSINLSHVVRKILFPDGFPWSFKKLTPLQKDFLYTEGAARTLFFLGVIPSLHRSTREEISNFIERETSKPLSWLKQAAHEIEAIVCAKKAAINRFQKLDGATVIIIFGSSYDFKPYCDERNFEHEVVNTVAAPSFSRVLEEKKEDVDGTVRTHSRRTSQASSCISRNNARPSFFTRRSTTTNIVVPIGNHSGLILPSPSGGK